MRSLRRPRADRHLPAGPDPGAVGAPSPPRRQPLERLFAAAFGLVGLALGARPISDNSTFVHLRTGVDIVAGRGIPRFDPYSATAAGTRWVVQSWLPAVAYGLAQRLDDSGGALLVLNGALTALLALLVHRLAGAGTPLRTLAAALVAVAVSGPWWSPRPLLVGLACLALTILVVEGGRRPWLLLPVAWIWVNSHGSFPLGALWLLATAIGAAIDGRRLVTARFRAGLWFAGGLLLGCVNPLGPRLLLFPLSLGERRQVFRLITEWRPADFQSGPGITAAVGLALAVVVLSRRRVPWTAVVPAGVFVLAGLLAQRNLAPAGIVLAPALGAALTRRDDPSAPAADRPSEPESSPEADAAGESPAPRATRRDRVLGALVVVAAVALLASAMSHGSLDLRDYPVAVAREAERQ
ncbi:MAG: MYXO-CTERM sorting domain-containing protein, partial [Acidimicrobiales bacterium]